MGLSYVGGKSTVGTGSTISVDLTALTGGSNSAPSAGDIVVVFWGWATNAGADASLTMNSSGYTYAFNDVWADDTREANMRAAYKIMGGTPDTTCIVNGPNNAAYGGFAVVQVWRGVDQSTPLTGTASATSGLNSNHGNPPAITPARNDAVVVCGMAGSGATTASGTKTGPTNYTTYEVKTKGDGSGADCYGSISARLLSGGSGASQDPAAYSGGSTTVSDGWCAGTLALNPALQSVQISGAGGAVAGGTVIPLSASDNFNRASLGTTDWEAGIGTFDIDGSVRVKMTSYGTSGAESFTAFKKLIGCGADQRAELKLTGIVSGYSGFLGVAVRCNGAGDPTHSAYLFYANATDWYCVRSTTGSGSSLGSGSRTFADGDILRIEVIGSSISCYVNGTLVGGPYTDTYFLAGVPGVAGYTGTSGDLNKVFGDDFSAGEGPASVQNLKYGRKESSSGGAVVGGTATVVGEHAGNTMSVTMAGGAIAGGAATAKYSHRISSIGGAIGGGAATKTGINLQVVSKSMIGGGLAGSSAGLKYGKILTVGGGALAGSTAGYKRGRKELPTGGGLAGGAATVTWTPAANNAVKSMTGGALAGGAAGLKVGLGKPMAGGALAGGSAIRKFGWRDDDDKSGAIAGGSATIKYGRKEQPTGGALGGSTAALKYGKKQSGAGGALAGGTAGQGRAQAQRGTGGALAGGAATVAWQPAGNYASKTMQGGAIAGGIFTVKASNKIPGSGGAIGGGGALVNWTPVISGTAQSRGPVPGEYAFDTRFPATGRAARPIPFFDPHPRIPPISGSADSRGAAAEARIHGYYRPEIDTDRPFSLGQADIEQALKSRQGPAQTKPGHAYTAAKGTITDDDADLLQALAIATIEEELNA